MWAGEDDEGEGRSGGVSGGESGRARRVGGKPWAAYGNK